MPLPSLQQFESAPLSLLAFGPGFGESLLIRTPEASWVAIDSASRQRKRRAVNPALVALETYDVELDVVLLTHPHEDHVKGLRDLIERCGDGAIVGAVEPLMRTPSSYAVASEVDDVAAITGGAGVAAHVAIERAWAKGRRKWTVSAGSIIEVGGCRFEVLTPGADALDEFASGSAFDLNDLSAAIRIKWANGGDLVLGADATAIAWEEASVRLAPENLLSCRPIKVSHHGSEKAIHRLLIDDQNPDPDRPLVVTPWNGGKGLPRFDPNQGVDRLLRAADSLQLTSLPFTTVEVSGPVSFEDIFASLSTEEVGDDTAADPLSIQLDRPSHVDSDDGVLGAWVLVQADGEGGFVVERGWSALEVVR
jgi:beta-lactamase superfamily II metal-dependent hydrolase